MIFVLITLFTTIIISPKKVSAVSANKVALVESYVKKTKEVPFNTERQNNGNSIYFTTPSQTYDFFDENNNYNLVYATEKNVYWNKYDSNMNSISEKVIPMFYDKEIAKEVHMEDITYNFGNAIYDNGYLYIVYGRLIRNTNDNVLAVVKYDKNGNEVKKAQITGLGLNPIPNSTYNATTIPFYSGECSLAIKDGILAIFMARHISGGHETSLLYFVDANNLKWLSNASDTSERNMTYAEATMTYNYCSHSFGQRIIPTSDGFALAEIVDANPRGLVLTKLSKYYDTDYNMDRFTVKKCVPFHFREGGMGTWGYNQVYSVIGSLLEVSDGYLYIGASEKTLSRDYGLGINESWNIFAQKYKKDFENYTQETMQLFKTDVRTTTGTTPSDTTKGRLYLSGTEKDYGVKWLTNYNNAESTILEVKAVPMENKRIALIWEENPIGEDSYGHYTRKSGIKQVYYEIIDENANLIDGPYTVDGVELNRQSKYTYKNGNIYWSTATGRNDEITINKLAVGKEKSYTLGDVNEDGRINTQDAIKVLQYISKKVTLTNTQMLAGDTTKDGKVNTQDAIKILQYIAKKITKF